VDTQDELRSVTCCFTGHRPDRLAGGYNQSNNICTRLRAALRAEIENAVLQGYTRFISGMAQGADMWAAEEVIRLRDKGYNLNLVAALPCPNQDSRWPEYARIKYRQLLERADEVHLISERYTPLCMGARNLWLVTQSSMVIALYDGGKRGGTANTLAHARRFGLHIVRINPADFR
jgi:uncharacterized phage-like protein YoqJ